LFSKVRERRTLSILTELSAGPYTISRLTRLPQGMMQLIQVVSSLIAIAGPIVVADGIIFQSAHAKIHDNRNDPLAMKPLVVKKLASAWRLKIMVSSMSKAPNRSTNTTAETAAIPKKALVRALGADDTSGSKLLIPTRSSLSSLVLQDNETPAGMTNRKLQGCDLDSLEDDFVSCASNSCSSCIFNGLTAFIDEEFNGVTFFCDSFEDAICPAIATDCDCGGCRDEAEEVVRCLVDEISSDVCRPLNCLNPPPGCDADSSSADFLSCASNGCRSCLGDALAATDDTDPSCILFATEICPAITTDCDCDGCRDEAEALFGSCICEGLICPLPTTPPTRGPTNPPSRQPIKANERSDHVSYGET